MVTNLLKHRWQKITGIVLLVLAVLTLTAALLINSILTPILSKKLKNAVLQGTDSLYRIDFSQAELHVFSGKAVLYNIALTPDTAVYSKMKRRKKAPQIIYKLQVRQLLINDAHPIKFLLSKKLHVGLISLVNPQVRFNKLSNVDTDTTSKDRRTVYQKLSKSLKLLQVSKIELNNINLVYTDHTAKQPAVTELKRMNLTATDLLIDSATQTDRTRTLFCKDITTRLYNFSGTSPKGLYTYRIKSASLSTQTARLNMTGVSLQPLSASQFFAKSKSDRFTIRMAALTLHHFDFDTYFKQQIFDVSNATLSKGAIDVYSNPNPIPQTTDRLVTFPHWMLRNLKLKLKVDTLTVENIAVSYKQYNTKAKKAGTVWFGNTYGRFLNITNKATVIKKNNVCTANLTTYFMGKGKLKVSFVFNLNNPNYNYSYTGHLGPMNMQAANVAVMPLGAIKIESGMVKSLDFNIHSTQKTSTGTVKFLYQNAKISLLRDEDSEGYHKKPVMSLLANTFIIKHDNPDDGSTTPRQAKVVHMRPSNSPFFQTLWFTLLKGLKACAGVGESKKQENGKKALTPKEIKEQEKALKKAKKEKEKEEKKHKKELEKKAKEAAKNN